MAEAELPRTFWKSGRLRCVLSQDAKDQLVVQVLRDDTTLASVACIDADDGVVHADVLRRLFVAAGSR